MFDRETLTLAELEETAAFKRLNEQQAAFVRTWIESGGNQFLAFQQAYSAPDVETARKGSYAVVQRRRIQDVLNTFLKKTPRELFVEEIDRVLRSRKPNPSKLRALELKSQIVFGVDMQSLRRSLKESKKAETAAAQPPAHIFRVGDIVTVGGRRIRVTVVSPDGLKALEGDPL